MPALLVESLVDKLLDYYVANLPAKCEALNAALGNPRMKSPQRGAYHPGELQLVDNIDYPKVFVLGRQTDITRYAPTWTDADHEVDIIVALKGSDTGDLQRLMYRYGRALWELTVARWVASTPDDFFMLHDEGDIRIVYGEVDNAQVASGQYIAKVTLTATFSKQEDN